MSERETAVYKVRIQSTVDAVWQELTRTDGLQRAMFNSRLETDGVAPGGQLRMRTPDGRHTSVSGEYIEVEKPYKLSHTFRFTAYDDPECEIVYTLREVEGEVELTLHCNGMTPGAKTTKQMKQGGPFIVNNLKAILETGKPTFGARLLFVLFKLMAPFNPRRSRSDQWPLRPLEGDSHAA